EPDPEATNRQEPLSGEIPSPTDPPSGCYFHTRCPIARDECRTRVPEFREVAPRRWVRCHFPGEPAAIGE
ncbi:MAG: oligopeptide/dipeptide ABC transporter ATP-binding protein, partial [Alphaproteobacteria bacterium]